MAMYPNFKPTFKNAFLRLITVYAFLSSPLLADQYSGLDSITLQDIDSGDDITFSYGEISFADQVIEYDPEYEGGAIPTDPDFIDPNSAIGEPELGSGQEPSYVSLGAGGQIVFRFSDNVLIGSDSSDPDLHIFIDDFFSGGSIQDTFVEISKYGVAWHSVGTIDNFHQIDIDAYGFSSADEFYYVRLTDDPNQGETIAENPETPGIAIDGVGAITTRPLSKIREVDFYTGNYIHLADNKPTRVYLNLYDLNVPEQGQWTAYSDNDWIDCFINEETGNPISLETGPAEISFIVNKNDSGIPRQTEILIEEEGGNVYTSFTILQNSHPAERSVYGMGDNIYGEAHGNGSFTAFHTPYPLSGYAGYKDVASASNYTLFLANDGTLSQLSNNNGIPQLVPETFATNVASLDISVSYTLYITNDNVLHLVSGNFPGPTVTEPTQETVVKAIGGYSGYFFITDTGDLWGVGNRNYGRLGNGRTESNDPVFIASNVVDAAISDYNGAYVTANGDLYAAGKGWSDWFGIAEHNSNHYTPEKIGDNVREIEATKAGLFILKNDDTLSVLGQDESFGFEPDGITHFEDNVASISIIADNNNNNSRAFFTTTNGDTYAMGRNNNGELGTGTSTIESNSLDNLNVAPKLVGSGIQTTGGNLAYTIYLNNDGTLSFSGTIPQHWKDATVFENNSSTEFHLLSIDDIAEVHPNYEHTWFLTEQKEVLSIGKKQITNLNGSYINTSPVSIDTSVSIMDTQYGLLLAKGDNLEFYPPNEYYSIQGPDSETPYTRTVLGILDLATSQEGIYWVDYMGNLYGIGYSTTGILGFRDTGFTSILHSDPILIDTNVLSVKAGKSHLLYTKQNKTLWAIGLDTDGQLGNGTENDITESVGEGESGVIFSSPNKIANNVEEIWAADRTSLFLKSDNTLWGMGFMEHLMTDYDNYVYIQSPQELDTSVIDASINPSGHIAVAYKDGTVSKYKSYLRNQLKQTFPTSEFGGRKAVKVDYGESPADSARQTSLYVTVSSIPSLDTESIQFTADGGDAFIGIDFNDPWIAYTDNSFWIHLAKDVSDGSDSSLQIVIDQNASDCPRSGEISIGGSIVTIVQLGGTGNEDCSGYLYDFKPDTPNVTFGTLPDSIELNWTDQYADNFQTTYELWRSDDNTFSNASIIYENSATTSYTDTDTNPGEIYYYWLHAYRDGSRTSFVDYVTGTTTLPVPEDFKASQGDFSDRIQLTWAKIADADSYTIYRARRSNFTLLQDDIVEAEFNDLTADDYKSYFYTITANFNGRESTRSQIVTGIRIENGISSLRASDGLFDEKISIAWDAFANATSYALFRNTVNDSSTATEIASNLTTLTHDDLISKENQGATYYYWVRATVDEKLESFSNVDQGNTPAQRETTTSLVAWGDNSYDQSVLPDEDLIEVIEIAAGVNHSLALRLDGTVIGWGRDEYGQATPPANLTDVIDIAVGYDHSLALKKNGTVVAWGRNTYGKATVPNIGYVIDIEAGADHSLALQANGTVAAWGGNGNGQTEIPANLKQVVEIAAGGFHNIARKADGSIAVWGDDTYGQLSIPTDIAADEVLAVASGWNHLLVITSNYIVRGWGDNSRGQLDAPQSPVSTNSGKAHIFSSLSVKPIATLDPFAETGKIIGISGGLYHSLALTDEGTLLSWGDNRSSQTDSPVTLSNVSKISAGDSHNMALGESDSPRIENIITGNLNPNPNSDQIIRVRATGGADIEYQWYYNGVAISGATTDTLVLSNLSPTDAGNYTVKVRSNGIEVESNPVTLTITGLILKTANIVGTTIKALLGANSTWLIQGIQTDPVDIHIGYDYNGSPNFPTPTGEYTIKATINHEGYAPGDPVTLTLTVQNVANNTRIEHTPDTTTIHYFAANEYKCILKSTTDMITWTTLETIAIGDGTMQSFTQPSAPGSHFRVSYEAP